MRQERRLLTPDPTPLSLTVVSAPDSALTLALGMPAAVEWPLHWRVVDPAAAVDSPGDAVLFDLSLGLAHLGLVIGQNRQRPILVYAANAEYARQSDDHCPITQALRLGALEVVSEEQLDAASLYRCICNARRRVAAGSEPERPGLQQPDRELYLLELLQTAIANTLGLTALFEAAVTAIRAFYGYQLTLITVVDNDRLRRVTSSGYRERGVPDSIDANWELLGQVVASGRPLLVPDIRGDAHHVPAVAEVVSKLCLPIFNKRAVYGALLIETTDAVLGEDDLRIMTKVANHISLAVENAKLHEQTRQDLLRTRALYQISKAIQSAADLETLMDSIISSARTALAAHWVIAYKVDFKQRRIEHVAVTHSDRQQLRPLGIDALSEGLNGWCIANQEPVSTGKDLTDRRESPRFLAAMRRAGLGSTVRVPLIYRGRPMGLIAAVNRQQDPDFSLADQALLSAVADQAVVALEQHQLRREIERQAHNDALTGLPNRLLFHDRLGQALAQARRSKQPFAVLFIDLDGFKHVNDSLGHHVGDALLVSVSRRLSERTRASDTLARMGGDEFALILRDVNDARHVTRIAEDYLALLQTPCEVDGRSLYIGASIGISCYPTDGDDASSLLRHADSAMYHAKACGKNSVRGFSRKLAEQARDRLELENSLRAALANEQLELLYQPQVDIARGQPVGVEALLRWRHPQRGPVSPQRFLAIAEETRLILPISEWVLRHACRQAVAWRKANLELHGDQPLRVSVNVSALQFEQANFLDTVLNALEESGLPPEDLELEVTESVVMNDINQVIKRLQILRGLGISIAIDDFGTGYSSLRYLDQLPFDCLKIDRSFVSALTPETPRNSIIETVMPLAKQFKLRTVAEGVETRAQFDYLRVIGCSEAQGFLFYPPLPADELANLFAAPSAAVS